MAVANGSIPSPAAAAAAAIDVEKAEKQTTEAPAAAEGARIQRLVHRTPSQGFKVTAATAAAATAATEKRSPKQPPMSALAPASALAAAAPTMGMRRNSVLLQVKRGEKLTIKNTLCLLNNFL